MRVQMQPDNQQTKIPPVPDRKDYELTRHAAYLTATSGLSGSPFMADTCCHPQSGSHGDTPCNWITSNHPTYHRGCPKAGSDLHGGGGGLPPRSSRHPTGMPARVGYGFRHRLRQTVSASPQVGRGVRIFGASTNATRAWVAAFPRSLRTSSPFPERTPMTEHLVPAADQRRLAAILLAGFDGETGNDGPADHHSRRNGWVDPGGVGSGKAVSTAGTASAIALLHSS